MSSEDGTSGAFEWFPTRLLQAQPRVPAQPHALVVLNQPLDALEPLRRIWRSAKLRVAADGGANVLVDAVGAAGQDFRELDAIVGDLDSLTDATRAYFATRTADGHAAEVLLDDDQYSTDFTKAVKLARQRQPGADIVAAGSLGGRVDQGVSQLHHLYLFDEPRHDKFSGRYRLAWLEAAGESGGADIVDPRPYEYGRTFLLTSDSLSFLLLPGRHHIHVREPSTEEVFAKYIGILPLQGPSIISTTGLEWDIKDWPTEFGGQVSTSNHVLPATQVVEVLTNRAVVFTIALADGLRRAPAQPR